MKILVTGGAGYIGSTVSSALLDAGHQPVILDSLVHGQASFLENRLSYIGDIADDSIIDRIFCDHPDIGLLMHFGALIDVSESMNSRMRYYNENLIKSVKLIDLVKKKGIERIIFSSTAAVYAADAGVDGLAESADASPVNPYARSKLFFEHILRDFCIEMAVSGVALRYFNPVGADPELRSGPYRSDPSHILGKLTSLAERGGGEFIINGDDYPTRDGTPIRDYIHVWDLARAHLAAVKYISDLESPIRDLITINVGSGTGTTVKECVEAFISATGSDIAVSVGPRRAGDTAGAFANTTLAQNILQWSPSLTLHQAICDAINWQKSWKQYE